MKDRELLEYIAAQVGKLTQDVGNLQVIQNDLKEFRTETNNRLTKIESSLENNIKPDIKATLEGYQMIYEKQKEHDKRLEAIENNLEKQDVEIRVIKGAK